MKKPKASLGGNGLKGFFLQHVEKFVFAIAILLVIAFVYLGYKVDSFEANKTPNSLKDLATRAVAHINTSSEKVLREERSS